MSVSSSNLDSARTARPRGVVARFCVGLLLASACGVAGGQGAADTYEAKAAFLYRLAKFVDWPPGKLGPVTSPLVIGVFGGEGLDQICSTLGDLKLDRRRLKVLPITDPEDFKECHILFVTRPRNGKAADTLVTTSQTGVLTVGESDRFIEAGGMLRFYVQSGGLKLEINDEAVRRAGLNIQASALAALINQGTVKLRRVKS